MGIGELARATITTLYMSVIFIVVLVVVVGELAEHENSFPRSVVK